MMEVLMFMPSVCLHMLEALLTKSNKTKVNKITIIISAIGQFGVACPQTLQKQLLLFVFNHLVL